MKALVEVGTERAYETLVDFALLHLVLVVFQTGHLRLLERPVEKLVQGG